MERQRQLERERREKEERQRLERIQKEEEIKRKQLEKERKRKKEIKDIKDIKENKEVNNQIDKKIIFNSYKLTPLSEEEKLEQKEKNRISARKSRFKKKQYITKLEQEHSLLLNQLEEIRQNLGINKKIIPLKEHIIKYLDIIKDSRKE